MSSPFDSTPPTPLPPEDPDEARVVEARREAALDGPLARRPDGRPPLENRFSWSKSRADIFGGCRRRYYLHYYAYWGGWEDTAPVRQRRLYVMRRLSSKEQWAGVAVHDAIARALVRLQRGRPFDLPRTVDETRMRMRAQWRGSRDGLYWRIRKGFGLLEHEYKDPVSDQAWKANWDLVERCLVGFARSAVLERIQRSDPARWKPIDRLDSFQLDGVDVWAAPDFAYLDADDHLEIIDWKTGAARDSDHLQLAGYTAFAEAKWGVPPERVRASLVYLARDEVADVVVDPASVAHFREEARASMALMRSHLADPARNVARAEDTFERTTELWRCRACAFRRECWGPEGRVPAEPAATPSAAVVTPALEVAPAAAGGGGSS